jgi:hypothetical protein
MPPARLRPGIVDTSIAVLLFGAACLELLLSGDGDPLGANLVAVVLTTLPLAWRSIAPSAAC